jgi:lysozyme
MVDPRLLNSLERHEGYRDKAYQDSEGIWTIGYGTNLQELRIDEFLARKWLLETTEEATRMARRFPEYHTLDTDARRNVFIEMVFNMGPGRVAGFRNMLGAIRDENFELAAAEMLDSKWARQVGVRAVRLSELMKNGNYQDEV